MRDAGVGRRGRGGHDDRGARVGPRKHLHAAFIAEDVPQCGYCQPGQIMSAAGLLGTKPKPTDADIDDTMSGNLCRCGTYQRIRKAIHLAAKMKAAEAK